MTNLVTNVICTVIINLITNGPTVTTDEVRQPYSDVWYSGHGQPMGGTIIIPAETRREVTEVIERRIVKFLYCDEEREIVSERTISYLERVWKRRDVWDEQPAITNKSSPTIVCPTNMNMIWPFTGRVYLNTCTNNTVIMNDNNKK